MRITVALFAALVLEGCADLATQAGRSAGREPSVYINEDAARMFLRDLGTSSRRLVPR